MNRFKKQIDQVRASIAIEEQKRQRLRNLDCIVLDNSLRESTVGQLRGHTLENKLKIYEEIKKCGFKDLIVASFSHMTRVDDVFLEELRRRGEDMSSMHAFSEVTENVRDGSLDTEQVPVGLLKMQRFGLSNPIFEIDLANRAVSWNQKFTVEDLCGLLLKWFDWARQHLSSGARIMVNLRDFPLAMDSVPERVLTVVQFLACLPANLRPSGLIYEDPTGEYLPEEMGAWTACVRKLMNDHDWSEGHLFVHVHKKWGLADHVQLECLVNGANGIWAGVCEEGAAVGHACSSITLMNLIRLGNKAVLDRYNCTKLREAAMNVTRITTGQEPHPKQIVYGERALDMSFDFGGIAGGQVGKDEFDIAAFFGIKPPLRINTLASVSMICDRLTHLFGEDSQFNPAIAEAMKEVMLEDLRKNRKEEYMSECGIALLFDRAGGQLSGRMRDVIERVTLTSEYQRDLIKDVRSIWDQWDLRDENERDELLQFDSFYNGFMALYFGCFRCEDTRRGLRAIDMDADGFVDWNEFLVYLKWAVREFPNIQDADELLGIVFRKGLLPAMRDRR